MGQMYGEERGMQMMNGGKGRGSTADFDMNVDPTRIVQQGQKIFSNPGASTCALTSVANLPSWQRGGSNANEQLQLLKSYGLRADLLAGYNETGIRNGRGSCGSPQKSALAGRQGMSRNGGCQLEAAS